MVRVVTRPSLLRTLWILLGAAFLLGALVEDPPRDWKSTKEWIREEFPEVPTLDVATLAKRLRARAKAPLLIDVRAEAEFATSHLRGAVRADDEKAVLDVLAKREKGRPVVLYCSVGYRSAAMTKRLRELGHEDVSNLEGSLFEWANEGLPVYRGAQRVEVVHPYDEDWGRLLDRKYWPKGWKREGSDPPD